MEPNGNIYFKDAYEQQYMIEWITKNSIIDITTTILQPYVWGESRSGKIENNNVYVKGIITINRQIISNETNAYTILADGTVQYIDYVRTTFNCFALPTDPFLYHYNSDISENIALPVTQGPGWYDLDDIGTTGVDTCVWADLTSDGLPSGSGVFLEWVDVWS
jgi:hypothetical protein